MFRLLVLVITLITQKKERLLCCGLLRSASTNASSTYCPLQEKSGKTDILDEAVTPIFGGVTDLGRLVDGGKIKWLSSFVEQIIQVTMHGGSHAFFTHLKSRFVP
jgi:hypothetical protein